MAASRKNVSNYVVSTNSSFNLLPWEMSFCNVLLPYVCEYTVLGCNTPPPPYPPVPPTPQLESECARQPLCRANRLTHSTWLRVTRLPACCAAPCSWLTELSSNATHLVDTNFNRVYIFYSANVTYTSAQSKCSGVSPLRAPAATSGYPVTFNSFDEQARPLSLCVGRHCIATSAVQPAAWHACRLCHGKQQHFALTAHLLPPAALQYKVIDYFRANAPAFTTFWLGKQAE